jgi:hypothetical protein
MTRWTNVSRAGYGIVHTRRRYRVAPRADDVSGAIIVVLTVPNRRCHATFW